MYTKAVLQRAAVGGVLKLLWCVDWEAVAGARACMVPNSIVSIATVSIAVVSIAIVRRRLHGSELGVGVLMIPHNTRTLAHDETAAGACRVDPHDRVGDLAPGDVHPWLELLPRACRSRAPSSAVHLHDIVH